jgi:hypothetical protein
MQIRPRNSRWLVVTYPKIPAEDVLHGIDALVICNSKIYGPLVTARKGKESWTCGLTGSAGVLFLCAVSFQHLICQKRLFTGYWIFGLGLSYSVHAMQVRLQHRVH